MNKRDNILHTVRFEKPDHISISFGISAGCWRKYPQDLLQELMVDHPLLFPAFRKSEKRIKPRFESWRQAGKPYSDSWGCVWKTSEDGITGAVTKYPLAYWSEFSEFEPPNSEDHNAWGLINWNEIKKRHFYSQKEWGWNL